MSTNNKFNGTSDWRPTESLKAQPKYSHFRGVSIVQVIKVTVNEGEGISGDPIQPVTYWYTMDGELISHNDSEIREFVPTISKEQP